MEEERRFALHMMKFIFQVSGSRLSANLQKLLQQYPIDEPSNFNEIITKAVLVLINELLANKKFPPDIGCGDFDSTMGDIQRSYTPLEFLKFCSSYGLKAALEYKEKKLESPTILYEAIMQIFETTKKIGSFTEESWDDLDKIASKIVADDEEMCRRQVQSGDETGLDMSSEREFILRTMDHIFSLYFRDMPGYLGRKLDELEDHEDNPFTPTISHALTCLMDSQMEVILNIGVEGIEKYFYDSVLKSYNERDFLELCVCYSRKAVLDFYEENELFSHLQVYHTLVDVLYRAKAKNKFISWDKMEDVANLIIEEDRERTESELEYLIQSSRSRSEHVEPEEYTPLIRVKDAGNLEYTPLMRVNEAENLEYTPLMRANEEENLEFTPLRVNEAENLLTSEQAHKRSCCCCKCS